MDLVSLTLESASFIFKRKLSIFTLFGRIATVILVIVNAFTIVQLVFHARYACSSGLSKQNLIYKPYFRKV